MNREKILLLQKRLGDGNVLLSGDLAKDTVLQPVPTTDGKRLITATTNPDVAIIAALINACHMATNNSMPTFKTLPSFVKGKNPSQGRITFEIFRSTLTGLLNYCPVGQVHVVPQTDFEGKGLLYQSCRPVLSMESLSVTLTNLSFLFQPGVTTYSFDAKLHLAAALAVR